MQTLEIVIWSGLATGIMFAVVQMGLLHYTGQTKKPAVWEGGADEEKGAAMLSESGEISLKQAEIIRFIARQVQRGSFRFIKTQSTHIVLASLFVSIVVLCAIGIHQGMWFRALETATMVWIGTAASLLCGITSLRIANASSLQIAHGRNKRTQALFAVFRGSSVIGHIYPSVGIGCLFGLFMVLNNVLHLSGTSQSIIIAGFGLGASTVALFGRLSSGLFATCVGSHIGIQQHPDESTSVDMVGSTVVVPRCAGHVVSNLVGIGADMFGSMIESICSYLVLATLQPTDNMHVFLFPFLVLSTGIMASSIAASLTMYFDNQTSENHHHYVKQSLRLAALIHCAGLALTVDLFMSDEFTLGLSSNSKWALYAAAVIGEMLGLFVSHTVQHVISPKHVPVQTIVTSYRIGSADGALNGLAAGFRSTALPIVASCIALYASHDLVGSLGIAAAAVGLISGIGLVMAIDALGPITQNAMILEHGAGTHQEQQVFDQNMVLVGNTASVIGKGYALLSSVLVAAALLIAFLYRKDQTNLNVMDPLVLSGILYGAMVPFLFSASSLSALEHCMCCMRTATKDSRYWENQDEDEPALHSISIGTRVSLQAMRLPASLALSTPFVIGYMFGYPCLAGVLVGIVMSGIQLSITMVTSGSAWSSARDIVKRDDALKGDPTTSTAADTCSKIGDAFKDTCGPALNILIKLVSMMSLLLATTFPEEGYLMQLLRRI